MNNNSNRDIIPSDFAKKQLVEINKLLTDPHLLIGGLAVQQYYKNRNSKDIDLVCNDETKRLIVDALYPNKDYEHFELNDDEYRPSFIAKHRFSDNQIIFFGPKILEREQYQYLNWRNLNENSRPFVYQNNTLTNIRVPSPEVLAYSKLLSFIDRVTKNQAKGECDLIDFINISNIDEFKLNFFVNLIRRNQCEKYISESLQKINLNIESFWDRSLFIDFVKIISPALKKPKEIDTIIEPNYDKVYSLEDSILFYEKIASYYDDKNSRKLKKTYQTVTQLIIDFIKTSNKKSFKVLDIGGGTGSIASSLCHYDNIEWHNVEPSKNMLFQFENNYKDTKLKYISHNCNVIDFKGDTFDFVLFSFSLSSINHFLEYKLIADFIGSDTKIIISDFHPNKIDENPYFDFNIQGKTNALLVKQVDPLDIINIFSKESFSLNFQKTIKNEIGKKFSYILEFEKQKNYKNVNEYYRKVNHELLDELSTDPQVDNSEVKSRIKLINNLSTFPIGVFMKIEDLVGEYSIMGMNQDADSTGYTGTLKLDLDSNNKIVAEWLIDEDQKQYGSGFYKDNILVINFNYIGIDLCTYKGVAVYRFLNRTILNGFWSEKYGDQRFLGKEQCIRKDDTTFI